MKRLIYLISAALMLASLAACTNSKEIQMASNVTLEIDTRPVIGAFTAWKSGNLDMQEGSYLRVACYIYDMEGNFVMKGEGELDDYSLTSWDIEDLPNASYQVVCVSYAISEKYDNEAYSIDEASDLDDLEIKQNFYQSFYTSWSCLGLSYDVVTVGTEPTVNISLAPACSYVKLHYSKMTSISDLAVDGVMFWMKNNVNASFEDNSVSYSHNLAESTYYTTSVSMPSGDYTGVYQALFLLPTDSMQYYATYTFGGESYDDGFGEGSCSIEAGRQYEIVIDCPNKSISVDSVTKGTTDSSLAPSFKNRDGSLNVSEYFNLK